MKMHATCPVCHETYEVRPRTEGKLTPMYHTIPGRPGAWCDGSFAEVSPASVLLSLTNEILRSDARIANCELALSEAMDRLARARRDRDDARELGAELAENLAQFRAAYGLHSGGES